jgi:hypothetical protein
MTIFSKQRRYLVAIEIVGILIAAVFLVGGEVLGAAEDRFTIDKVQRDLATRVNIWITVITNPSPWIAFCGEGYAANWIRLGKTTPHNAYLDVIFLWGLGGVTMFCVLIQRAVKWSRRVVANREVDSCSRALAWGLYWSLVASIGLGITSSPWYSTFYRCTIYFLVVVACVRYLNLRESRLKFAAPAQGAAAPAAHGSLQRR